MSKIVRVKGPLAILVDKSGRDRYLYNKAVVAADEYDAEHVDRLVEEGLLERVDAPAVSAGDQEKSSGAGSDDGPPAKAANKDAWVAFAVSKGATQEEAEASNKDDLITKYGG